MYLATLSQRLLILGAGYREGDVADLIQLPKPLQTQAPTVHIHCLEQPCATALKSQPNPRRKKHEHIGNIEIPKYFQCQQGTLVQYTHEQLFHTAEILNNMVLEIITFSNKVTEPVLCLLLPRTSTAATLYSPRPPAHSHQQAPL